MLIIAAQFTPPTTACMCVHVDVGQCLSFMKKFQVKFAAGMII